MTIQPVGNEREHHIQVYLNGNSGAQCVQMKEVDVLGDPILDEYAACVALDQLGCLGLGVVREEQCGLFMAQLPHGYLTKGPAKGAQRDRGFSVVDSAVAAAHPGECHPFPCGRRQGFEITDCGISSRWDS